MQPNPDGKAQVEKLIDIARDLAGGGNADPSGMVDQMMNPSAPLRTPATPRKVTDIRQLADLLSKGLPLKG